MKIAAIIIRLFLGFAFVVFGANAFLRFLPMPPLPENLAGDFLRVFFASGYVYVIGGMQVLCGFFLLIGRFVPLALTILGAIFFNIWAFHILMAPADIGPAVVFTVLWAFLVWRYREAFAGILRP